ncbi:MAG: ABC transporter ATP-binding protein/permease [Synechococcaceae cyanobacterium]|nr:ABC transporter ATP-binding protein/permease [Synechococcaceae cyanobacterium]
MTNTRMQPGPVTSKSSQLQKLRNLSQPFFLPLDQASGWQFIWLLISLLFCVGGTVLLIVTQLSYILMQLQPVLTEKYLGGVARTVSQIWSSWWGIAFSGLFLVGLTSFVSMRKQLKGRRWLHWVLLGLIVFMLLAVNGINAGIGFIARDLTNALVEKQQENFYLILTVYACCFLVALPIRVSQFYLTQKLGLIWRDWLSRGLIADYMHNRAYYVLNPNDETATDVDNPDQRITDDTRSFTSQSLGFTLGIFDAILTFSLNIIILWSISQKLTWALFFYALIATIVLVVAGLNLVRVNYNQLRYEADFRYGLVHIRDNAESIAFYSGEEPEVAETLRRLSTAIRNFDILIIWQVIIGAIQRSVGYAGNFFPYLIMAGAYFSGQIDYGRFIQASFAFSMVESSLMFVVNNITELAQFSAGVSRLEGFQSKVEQYRLTSGAEDHHIPVNPDSIVLRAVDIRAPGSESTLIEDLSLTVGQGERLLVVGPSGCGKTSLLRMVSGLWAPESGTVERPETGDLLFIPQKPYMILGSLREQLCYPGDDARYSNDQLRHILQQVRLEKLAQRYPDLDVKQDWTRVLSLGEQQRLAFGRLLLHSPKMVVLDEATSAVDVPTEEHLYQMLLDRELAVVSVGHRNSLIPFHENVLRIRGGGQWELLPMSNYISTYNPSL